jgi:hypothetical protein
VPSLGPRKGNNGIEKAKWNHVGVVAVLDSVSFRESWIYNCTHCLAVWQEDYSVQCNEDGHGHDAVLYFRDGQRCVSPWVDHTCPNCHAASVKARPTPWAARQPRTPLPRPRRSDTELLFRLRGRLHAY